MSVIGDFTVPSDSFALHHALTSAPEVTVEADRLASHSTREVLPFLWASGGDSEQFEAAFDADQTVDSATVAERTDDGALYRLQWADEVCELVDEMVDHHAAIVEASAQDGEWDLRLRFAEEDQISEFQRYFRDSGRDFEVHHLSRPSEPRQREFGLTTEQYEALVAAVRNGYFEVPRGTSVDELGALLGISANSVSQRLRRGNETLVRNALIVAPGDAE